MSLTKKLSNDGKELTISISGMFGFSQYKAFRKAYEAAPETVEKYMINFSDTKGIDSSVIGMLMVMKERTESERANIVIKNANPEIMNILSVTKLNGYFTIVES